MTRASPSCAARIQRIAADTDVRHLPAYAPPSIPALINAAKDFQAVKDHLIEGDRAKLLTRDSELEMNLSVRISLENVEALAIARNDPIVARGNGSCRSGDPIISVTPSGSCVTADATSSPGSRTKTGCGASSAAGSTSAPEMPCAAMVETEARYGHDNELIDERFHRGSRCSMSSLPGRTRASCRSRTKRQRS